MWNRLQTWKGKLFSQKGREVLLKAVALALPTYTMQVFHLSDTLCSEFEAMMARFWWGGSMTTHKLHSRKWSKLCRPKREGGLGFKDLRTFNKALLAKQRWRILQCLESLVARVLKGKYFSNVDFLTAKIGTRPSYLWRSLPWRREFLI